MSEKTIEQIKNEGATNHSSVYTNNDFRIRAAVGFECGFDAAIQLCEQRERDLVEALEKIENGTDEFGDLSAYDMSIISLSALKKHRGENDSKDKMLAGCPRK